MTDFFGSSGRNGRNSAVWTAQYLNGQQDQANRLLDAGKGAAEGALNANRGIYRNAFTGGLGAINSGYGQADNALQGSRAQFEPFYTAGVGATNAYGDAMGLNGADGSARATAAFSGTPGYAFARDQGLDAINRTAAARGGLAGGNTSVDLLKYATGFADQTYGNYLQRLMPLMQGGQSAAQSMAGIDASRASELMRAADDRANLYGTRAAGLAGVNTAEAGLESGTAKDRAQALLDLSKQITDAGQKGFSAGDQAAQNRFGAVMGGINLGTKLLGML